MEEEYGEVMPGFLYIVINGDLNVEHFEQNSPEQQGTFVHEYCHFLQFVSTTYGYFAFTRFFEEYLYKIGKVSDKADIEALEKNLDYYTVIIGDNELDTKFHITDIRTEKDEELFRDPYIMVEYNGDKQFCFGTLCIFESMAYLAEKQLYDIRIRSKEFPYCVCEEICKYIYPEISKKDSCMMALCELALLEANPGPFFIKALELMKDKRFLPSKVDDVVNFIDQNYKIGFRGYREQIESLLYEIYPECGIDFSGIRNWILSRFEKGCLYRESNKCFITNLICNKNFDYLNYVIRDFGCPPIINSGRILQGAMYNGREIDVTLMLVPVAIYDLLDYQGKFMNKKCWLADLCKVGKHPFYSEQCSICFEKRDYLPSDELLCPVNAFLKIYNVPNKSDK